MGYKQKKNIAMRNTAAAARPKIKERTVDDARLVKMDKAEFPLSAINFKMMIVSAILIVAGFLLMLGGSSTEEQYNPDIFSVRRIVIGPTLAFLGFVAVAVSIIYSPRRRAARNMPDADAANIEK